MSPELVAALKAQANSTTIGNPHGFPRWIEYETPIGDGKRHVFVKATSNSASPRYPKTTWAQLISRVQRRFKTRW